ncbi:hypothetical protein LCGC14_1837110, partial [marine sediment metagenome]
MSILSPTDTHLMCASGYFSIKSVTAASTLDANMLCDAKSLSGGTLLLTPLQGVDGKVYALAQGAVAIGG